MRYLGISCANGVYASAEVCQVDRHRVSHVGFRDFSISLSRFIRRIEPDDDFWTNMVQTLRRYGFALLCAPLPFSHPAVCSRQAFQTCTRQLRNCELMYPQLAAEARTLMAKAAELCKSDENPLLDGIVSIGPGKGSTAILVRESWLISAVEQVVAADTELRPMAVISPAELRGPAEYNRVFTVGPARWLPDYVFTAPRAREIHIVLYTWVSDRRHARRAFITPSGGGAERRGSVVGPMPTEAEEPSAGPPETPDVDVDEFLPRIDLDHVGTGVSSEETPENVEALLFALEGGAGVFLESSEGASVMIIDPEEEGKARARRVSCSDVEVGMFVMLRTAGGGDYIVPVADRIMASEAPAARERQRTWKGRLRDTVRQLGFDRTCAGLRDLGSLRANRLNLRNWISERFIRPRDKGDFMAIAQLVGLDSEAEDIWRAMRLIDRAHKTAGQQIRKLLLREVLASDLVALERHGRMDFELPEADGGSLTAFRIAEISERTFWVPPVRIGHPFRLEEELWRG